MNELKFLHIPKAGGSSIEYAANAVGIKWGKFDRKNLKGGRGGPRWHCPQSLPRVDMFCIVRNPFDKIISQFYHMTKNINRYQPGPLNNWVSAALNRAQTRRHYQGNHLLPQINFVKHSAYVLCFDRIQTDLDQLLEIYGLPSMIVPHHYGGKRQQRKRTGKSFRRLQKTDLTPSIRKEIKKFYQKDFQIYNLISTLDGPYKVK